MSLLLSAQQQELLNTLFEAARSGDDGTVLSFVPAYQTQNKFSSRVTQNSPSSINALTAVDPSNNTTVAHVAASNGHLRLCRLLLERGMPVDCVDNMLLTPLRHAASNNHLDVVKMYLDEGKANVNAIDVNGQTALFKAVLGDSPDLINLLLSRGASVSVEDNNGKTPISLAKSKGKGRLVALLNSHRQQQNNSVSRSSRAVVAVSSDATPAVVVGKEFLQKLFSAVREDNVSLFKELLQSIEQNEEEQGKIVISAIDPDDMMKDRKNLLHTACFSGSFAMVKLLLEEYSLSVETIAAGGKRFTPLDFACDAYYDSNSSNSPCGINLSLIEYLLHQHHANANHQDLNGQTVLHRACLIVGNSNQELISLLLKYDADIDVQDYNFKTPLELARVKGKNAIVKMFQNHIDKLITMQNNTSLAAGRRAAAALSLRTSSTIHNNSTSVSRRRRSVSPTTNGGGNNESSGTTDDAYAQVSRLETSQNHLQRELTGCRNEIERLRMELFKSRDQVGQLKIQKEAVQSHNAIFKPCA